MKDLKTIQKDFQDYLIDEKLKIVNEIQSTKNLSAKIRLNIYRDSYYLRLIEILEKDYPILFYVVGEDNFFTLSYAYIDKHPSHFRSIQYFGRKLPQFIKNYVKRNCLLAIDSQQSNESQKWLTELAQFECLLSEVFDECDAKIINVDGMAAIPFEKWPMMKCVLHPSLRLLKLNWQVVPLWNELMKKKDQESSALQHFIPEKQKSLWMIWRKEYEVQFLSLQKEEFFMLEALMNKNNFSEICEKLCQWIAEDEVATYAATLLKKFILDGVISQIVT